MNPVGPSILVRTYRPFLSADKANTDIEIKMYLEGRTEPVLQGNMLGLLDGSGEIPLHLHTNRYALRFLFRYIIIPIKETNFNQ